MTRLVVILLGVVLVLAMNLNAQNKPDFTGVWTLDTARSGRQTEIWNQGRADRFGITQNAQEVTIDTGDGSLFGVIDAVVDGPLVYKVDGSPVIVVDRSLGDLPAFARKIRTEASWDDLRLVTLTTHYSETEDGASGGVTRRVTFSMLPSGEMTVERTGYRSAKQPPIVLHGRPYRREDDLVYARDTAVYVRLKPSAWGNRDQ